MQWRLFVGYVFFGFVLFIRMSKQNIYIRHRGHTECTLIQKESDL